MKFVSFSACTGWYWVTSGGKTAMPVAGWAVTDTGDVVGMIVSGVQDGGAPKLNPPAGNSLGGSYVQEQQLNETARATLKRPSM